MGFEYWTLFIKLCAGIYARDQCDRNHTKKCYIISLYLHCTYKYTKLLSGIRLGWLCDEM